MRCLKDEHYDEMSMKTLLQRLILGKDYHDVLVVYIPLQNLRSDLHNLHNIMGDAA